VALGCSVGFVDYCTDVIKNRQINAYTISIYVNIYTYVEDDSCSLLCLSIVMFSIHTKMRLPFLSRFAFGLLCLVLMKGALAKKLKVSADNNGTELLQDIVT
jgi:hypothetical protein